MKIRVGFGLGTTASTGLDGEKFWSIIDTLESGGWDSVWLSERVTGDLPDVLTGMAALAGRTRRLKFGPSVMVLPGRNPVLLAKALATIDVLSGGRLVVAFGLGADVPTEQQAFQVNRRHRAAITDEATLLIKRLWSETDVTHQGRFFQLDAITVKPRPLQQPHPDVWFGGHSPAALSRVGRIGDGWLPSFVAPEEYGAMADVIRRTAAGAGREVEDEHYGALVPYVRDPGAAEAIAGLLRARRPDADPSRILAVGGNDVLRAHLERFMEQGASKFVVLPVAAPPDWRDELASLHAEVARTLEN